MKVSFIADKPATSALAVILIGEGLKAKGAAADYIKASNGQFAKAAKAAFFKGANDQSLSLIHI